MKDRLKILIDDNFSGSAYRAAKETGISEAQISRFIAGKSKPSFDVLRKFGDYGINLNWLIMGEGEKYLQRKSNAVLEYLIPLGQYLNKKKNEIIITDKYELYVCSTNSDMFTFYGVKPGDILLIQQSDNPFKSDYDPQLQSKFHLIKHEEIYYLVYIEEEDDYDGVFRYILPNATGYGQLHDVGKNLYNLDYFGYLFQNLSK